MKNLVPYLLLLCTLSVSAQGWRQTLEGVLSPSAVSQTPDGGAVFLSNTLPVGPQGRQIVLSKTDQDGQIQWQKIIGAPGDDEGRSLVVSSEGNIAVAGKMSFLANNGDALLVLFDLNGHKIWERNYNFGVLDDAKCVRQMPDGGFALAVEADNQLRLLRTDTQGMGLWSKAFPSTDGLIVKHLEIRSDGGFVVTLLRNTLPLLAPAAVVLQISPVGDLEFQTTLPHFSNYITTDQVRCKPSSDSTFWLMHRDSVYLLNRDTTVLNSWQIASSPDFYLTDLIPADDGGFFALGTQYSFSGAVFSRAYFARFQANGTEVWHRYFDAPSAQHATWAAAQTQDGGFLLTGNYAKNAEYFSYLLRTDSLGQVFTNQISGSIFWDQDNDCVEHLTEPPLAGWVLKLTRPNGDLHYTSTDSTGQYHLEAGIGEHSLSVLLPNGLWTAACVQDELLQFDLPFQSETLDFPIKNTTFCPLPRVDAGVDYWLHCAENTFVVRYSNAGTADIENAAVVLRLDSLLTLTDASLAFSQVGPNTWQFSLGDLDPLATGSFWVKVLADCGTETLGRTLCVEATITPNNLCLEPLNGPLLVAEGVCEGDSVRFRVWNIGLPMTGSLPYIVVEDDVMLLQGMQLQLGAAEELVLRFPANGSTWRFEVLQNPGTPDWLSDQRAAAVVEGCSASGSYSTGYVNQFSLYDGGYFSETECRAVVANVQNLEKTAYPMGWGSEHSLPPNTDLEYALHYQNNTGDSVLALTLRDTLDPILLDPASVLPGPASHPYQFELSGAGVLTFRFMGIALADSARAWVKFRVRQQPDLALGTVIRNHAWAYADFDAPMPTNETFHTIDSPFLVQVATPHKRTDSVLLAWPLPTTGAVTLELRDTGDYWCQITDLRGRTVLEQKFSGNRFVISDAALPSGIFFATVFQKGRRVGITKIVKTKS